MEPGPITEFPFFTFLYADLHAHMIALPLTVVGLAWGLSKLLQAEKGEKRNWIQVGLSFFTGALILGALRPTNTWDFPVYLGLGVAAAAASVWVRERRLQSKLLLEAVLAAGVIVVLALLLYQPFAHWYGTAYTHVDAWEGGRTSLDAYLTVHGLFLFILASWMMWETRQWMASTPISALKKLRRYASLFFIMGMIFIVTIAVFISEDVVIAILVIPLILWAGLLSLRRGMPLEKRLVLILTAVALGLTSIVEIVVLRGDIGRMNTVFKFYLQVWTLFSVSAGAAIAWLLAELPLWRPTGRRIWGLFLGLLVFCAALYPITAAPAKMRDRMSDEAPKTLDGMTYMPYTTYYDFGQSFRHDEDYRAIRWMQDNVQGSPVIVEANAVEYRWGSRFSVYTGLPGVLGWNWHQRQQRLVAGEVGIVERAFDIASFYLTRSVEEAVAFLDTYDVQYVIVGQMERVYYETIQPCWPNAVEGETITCEMAGRPMGMEIPDIPVWECQLMDPQGGGTLLTCPTHAFEKFDTMVAEGILREAYRDGQTVIYEVLP
jgi:YYY domain-containing protein